MRIAKKFVPCIMWLLLFSVLLYWGFSVYNGDFGVYAGNMLARYDSTLFTNDFVAQAAAKSITPQWPTDVLMMFFLQLGLSWQGMMLVLYLLSAGTLCGAIVYLSYALPFRYRLPSGVLLLTGILYITAGYSVGGNPIWIYSFVHQLPAVALCLWSMAAVVGRRRAWGLAYLLNTAAMFFQLHIGFYLFAFLLVLQLWQVFQRRKYKSLWLALIPLGTLLLIYGAVSISSSASISGKDFVDIYAILRHPHHLVPSSWGMNGFLEFSIYAAGILALGIALMRKSSAKLLFNAKDRLRGLLCQTAWLILLVAGLLVINYLFIEVFPWALVAKIQPGRAMTVLKLWIMLMLAICFDRMLRAKQWSVAALLVSSVICLPAQWLGAALLLCALLVFLHARKPLTGVSFAIVVGVELLAALGMMVWKLWPINAVISMRVVYLAAVFAVGFLWKARNRIRMAACSICLCLLFTLQIFHFMTNASGRLQMKSFNSLFGTYEIEESLQQLAAEFAAQTPKDAVFFADPMCDAMGFRLLSQRAIVISNKNVAITDDALLEWADRMIVFGAVEKDASGYHYTGGYQQMAAKEIMDKAAAYGAAYLFTTTQQEQDQFVQEGAELWLQSGRYSVLIIPQ